MKINSKDKYMFSTTNYNNFNTTNILLYLLSRISMT